MSDREHKVYPYLLRGAAITRPNQVRSAGITYVAMPSGFVYLAATVDGSAASWCRGSCRTRWAAGPARRCWGDALSRATPGVFDTDQGVRFTARAWTTRVEDAGVSVSVDGRGRRPGDVFVERLWRGVKYECVHPSGPESVRELERGLGEYFGF